MLEEVVTWQERLAGTLVNYFYYYYYCYYYYYYYYY